MEVEAVELGLTLKLAGERDCASTPTFFTVSFWDTCEVAALTVESRQWDCSE